MSRPIVVTVCMGSSSESWELYQPPLPWHSRAGWRSRPQHQEPTYAVQQAERSFDHLVGDGKQRRGHVEANHPGRLGVDDQLKLARLHDRQVSGPRAFEDTTGVHADLTITVQNV